MEGNERFVPRLAPLTLAVKSLANPQIIYNAKAQGVRAERTEAGVVTLYRRDDLMRINRHPAVLGPGGRGGNFGNDNPLIPLEIDGEEHKKWRRLLDPLFAPKQMARLEAAVRNRAAQLVDGFAGQTSAELYQAYCAPLPCFTFLELLGAPLEDIEFFTAFKNGVLHPQGETREEIQANQAAAGAMLLEYFTGLVARQRAEGAQGEEVLAVLLRSRIDGQPLTDAELFNIIHLLIFAGLDTVTASMSCILAWLGQHPHERRRLVEDTARIPAAIEELMRYESPEPSGIRYATADIDLSDGLTIRAGEAIHVSWAAANVDPTAHPDPLHVDFDRARFHHLAFGSGIHRCLGSHLARLELRVALEEFLARIPDYAVDTAGLVYDNVSVRTVQHLRITFNANTPSPVDPSQRHAFMAPLTGSGTASWKGTAINTDDMILISVDDHIVEPPDMFDNHLPAKYLRDAPRLVRNPDGSDVWKFRDSVIPNPALNAVAGRPKEEYGLEPQGLDEIRPGCYQVDERVKDMNAGGILASICFPSFPGFAGRRFATDDPDFSLALIQAYNDWHIDQWCGAYPARFIPMALPVIWDAQACATEVRRVSKKGVHALTFTENPATMGYPSFHNDYWNPLWKALCDTNTVMNIHFGSSGNLVTTAPDAPIDVLMTLGPMNIVQAAADLLWSRPIKDYPDLKIGLSEGGTGWISYFLERADRVFEMHSTWTHQDFGGKVPSEVFREHFLACFISDPVGVKLRNMIGIDNIAWEADYPHSDSMWPGAPEELGEVLTANSVPDLEVDKMTHLNAMRWYSFDPFSRIPREQATVGALRKAAAGHDVSTQPRSQHKSGERTSILVEP